MTVDAVTRPNALVSGRVVFSDGEGRHGWWTSMGVRGWSRTKGYRPSPQDIQDFQVALEKELVRLGLERSGEGLRSRIPASEADFIRFLGDTRNGHGWMPQETGSSRTFVFRVRGPISAGQPWQRSPSGSAVFPRIRSCSPAFGTATPLPLPSLRSSRSVVGGIALKILGQQQDAEDVLQDAAVLIWEQAPQYRPELGQPLSWAVALTRNKAIDRLRSVRRRTEVHESAASQAGGGSVARNAFSPSRRGVRDWGFASEGLQMLSMEQREAIELAFWED